jgi:hypothetical protein
LIFSPLSFRVAAVNGCLHPVAAVFGMTAIQTPILMSLRVVKCLFAGIDVPENSNQESQTGRTTIEY